MNVREVMISETTTIGLDDSVGRVRDLFVRHAFHHLLVVGKGKLVGVISDRDLLDNLSPFVDKLSERSQDMATLKRRVHQIMTRKLVTVTLDTTVEDASHVMLKHGVSCLPVVAAEGCPKGIVTWRDLLSCLCGPVESLIIHD